MEFNVKICNLSFLKSPANCGAMKECVVEYPNKPPEPIYFCNNVDGTKGCNFKLTATIHGELPEKRNE